MIHVDGAEVIGEGIVWLENNVSKYVTKCVCFVGTKLERVG